MTVWMLAIWAAGLIVGFSWGCETGLAKPAFAAGFLRGFYSPFLVLLRIGGKS